MNTMHRIIMNIPPPLPLMRSSAICINYNDGELGMGMGTRTRTEENNAKESGKTAESHQKWISLSNKQQEYLDKNTYRKQSGGFIDIDKPYNICIPAKLNRQVSV